MSDIGACPICGEMMKKSVFLYLWADADQFVFDKKALRKKEIQITGAGENNPMKWICLKHGYLESILEKMERKQ